MMKGYASAPEQTMKIPHHAEATRQPAAYLVAEMAETVSRLAGEVADRAGEKLQPIMSGERPCTAPLGNEKDQELPPLFQSIKGNLETITAQLHRIENYLDRTEL